MECFRRAMDKLGVTGKIIATDITSASPAFHKADVGVKVPTVRRVEYLPSLLDAVKTHKVGLLVPLTDLDLRSLARHRDDFAKIGCTVMVGSEPIVRLCRDKALTNQLFEKVGLATIKSFTLNEFMKRPFFPCFVKPSSGSAGIGATVVKNDRELQLHISAYGRRMVVQEIAQGQEYTIDVYRSRDGQVRCVVPRQRLAVRSGEVEKGITLKDRELIERPWTAYGASFAASAAGATTARRGSSISTPASAAERHCRWPPGPICRSICSRKCSAKRSAQRWGSLPTGC